MRPAVPVLGNAVWKLQVAIEQTDLEIDEETRLVEEDLPAAKHGGAENLAIPDRQV